MSLQRICLLGFGEVGTTLAQHLSGRGLALSAFDTQFENPQSTPVLALHENPAVASCESAAEAARTSDLVVSAVTAEQCVAAASSVSEALTGAHWYLDLNSVAPATKRRAATIITHTGARYVEAAVMSPIHPLGAAAPMLLGGPHADSFATIAAEMGFAGAETYSTTIGDAAAAKMCRSVCIKGLEALVSESLLAARRYGVESTVLESLANLMPGVDWRQHAFYLLQRSIRHGERRAEEMREVAATLRDAGIAPLMTEACVERQEMAAMCTDLTNAHSLTALLDDWLSSIAYPDATGEDECS